MLLPSVYFPSIDSLHCILCSSMIISQVDSIRDRGTMMASHTAQEFQILVLLSYFFFMENNKLLEVKFKVDFGPTNRIPYQWLFLRVSSFRFIRDSHRSANERTRVNCCPLLHKYFYFLKNRTRSVSPNMAVYNEYLTIIWSLPFLKLLKLSF